LDRGERRLRFKKKVEPEVREWLREDLLRYESEFAMTSGERLELHEWVSDGNSPFENPGCYTDESGNPLDFVTAARVEADLRKEPFQSREAGWEPSADPSEDF
jgi:hypothetical protein